MLVAHHRRVAAPAGVIARRSRRFDEQVSWNLSPPRMTYDDTVIEIADTAERELDLIAALADACGGRRTTAARLRARIDTIPRLHRRALLTSVLDDVAVGTCSVLEHRYLTDVERRHGLPRGTRQDRVVRSDRRMFRDVVYRDPRRSWVQVVELDGRLDHDSATARDRDMERDLDAAIEREHTVRLGYGQVLGRPCRTAAKIGRLLNLRGWNGTVQRCPDCPD
ncbi:hypothetical protein [Nocardioides sp. MH1]|uniref:hypothetical protein n=1 Tax=Nocardioides sp. MH1 TaxID=3242490 RepID=UPI003521F7E1